MLRRILTSFWSHSYSHSHSGHQQIQLYHNNFNNLVKRSLFLTANRLDLMEFFDDPKNWGETEVKSGRWWKVDELRIKSNSDLHKLWYILLKEKNMLLTMEYAAKKESELFPNPERIDKVEESMKNIESVVRERNRSYYLLETGETGERPGAEFENFLGLQEYREFNEHHVPKEKNRQFLIAERDEPKSSPGEKAWFLTRWKVKQKKMQQKVIKRQEYEVVMKLKEFPNCDKEALQELYPLADVPKYVKKILENKVYDNFDNTKIPYYYKRYS